MEGFIAICLCVGLLTFYLCLKAVQKRNLPPGPRGIPFFGNLFQFDSQFPHLKIEEWSKKHGDIFKINCLGNDIVVLSGDEFIREVMVTNSDAFADRPALVRWCELFHKGRLSISGNNCTERWMKVKKVVMTSVKAYGDGLKRIETLTLDAARDMLECMDSHSQNPFDPQDVIQVTFARIIYTLIFSEELGHSDARDLLRAEREGPKFNISGGKYSEIEVMPWLKHIRRGCERGLSLCYSAFSQVIEPAISRCKSDNTREEGLVIGALLNHMEKEGKEGDSLSEHDIISLVIDLLFAGFSTSSAALYSLVALCITHPEVKDKIQEEIDEVLGSQTPSLGDRSNLHYVNATILELLRLISHVPLAIPHCTRKEVTIGGYNLPQGQEVWLNLWSLHHDERFWDEPYAFKPERFLTADGELVSMSHINRRRLMPFGAGRRVCIGESLAKSRLFMLVCLLYQRFDILPEADDKLPISDPRQHKAHFVLRPESYKIRCVPRKNIF